MPNLDDGRLSLLAACTQFYLAEEYQKLPNFKPSSRCLTPCIILSTLVRTMPNLADGRLNLLAACTQFYLAEEYQIIIFEKQLCSLLNILAS